MLLVMLCGTVYADAYTADFNTAITTSSHDFKVASNWKHIVHRYNDGYFDYWMSYSYGATTGVNGSGALYAGEQRAGDNTDNEVTYDMLVTPVVSGDVTIYVKKNSNGTPFIEFWSLNETGTAKNVKLHEVKTFEANAWVAVTYQVATPQRIGIRAQYLYLDNFSATNAVIEPEKSISITSAEPSATNGTIYWDQQANGKVKVSYTVTVTNNGEVDLTQGTPNYSISVFNRKTNEVYFTVPVPQDLAIGANSEPFEVAGEVEPTTWTNSYTYINMDLKENLQGSIILRAQSHYKAYEPKFIFRVAESTSTSSLNSTQAYGLISEATTRKFEIRNDGTAPLIIKSISLPEGFTSDNKPEIPEGGYTIAKNTALPLNITLPVDARGNFSGDLVITYLDKNNEEQTYTLGFSGNVLAANTWYVDFDNTKSSILFAEGSVAESGIRYDYSYDAGLYNYYLYSYTSDSYANANNKFITPKLHASAGDKLVFDVRRDNSGEEKYNLKVYVSTDRKTWGEPKFTVSAANLTSSFQTKEITFDEEGDYYVAFAVYGVRIDNVIGLTKVDVSHDLYIKSVSWPDASIKSGTSQSKPTVDIIPLTNETAGNYTVKYVSGETVLAEGIPVALTASATSSKTFTFNWTPQVENTTTYKGSKIVFEFTDGKKFETEGFDLTVTNEPIFHFVNAIPSGKWNEPTDHTTPVSFGKTNAAEKKTFYVYNWGSAPLTVKSIAAPEGFTATPAEQFTVVAFDENNLSAAAQPVEITFSATHPATYNGDMVITYIDGTGAEKTFTLPISGTKLDPTKYYANFDDQNWPAGSVYQKNIEMINGGTYSEPNYHITASSSTENIFVTPKLTAASNDTLKFDAKLYNSNWADGKIVVYAAATREEILDFDPENDTRKPLFSVSGKDIEYPIISDYRTFKVPVNVAGDYYFGFEISGRPYMDEIYGLEPTAVAHDLKIASSSIPAEGMQNVEYKVSANIQNFGLAEEAADSYTVTVYVDNNAVATGQTVAIPVNHKLDDAGAAVSATFRYPKVGTFPVYIEVKAGDYTIATEPVNVTFAEEIAISEAIEVGSGTNASNTYAPIDFYNFEQSRTSDILYTSAQLNAFGLKAGDKITSLAFKGSASSAKTLSNSSLKAWVALSTGIITYSSPDKSAMTEIAIFNAGDMAFVSGDNMITMNLPEAITYDGTSDLRIYLEGGGNNEYISLSFAYDNNYQNMKWSNNSSMKANPLLYVTLAAEPATISGTVKNSEGTAIENATVTLVSADGDNVQYEGTTDAEGAYSFNVIQSGRTYNATVVAEEYKTATAEISFAEGSVTKNFVLADANPLGDANLDGEVTTSDAVAAVTFALEKEVPSEKALKVADVNKSGAITVSDAVGIVNIALNTETPAPARGEMEAVNFLTKNGTSLNLTNSTAFVGFQMDVTLTEGALLNDVTLADRAAKLQVVFNRIADNTYRIIAFSTGNAAIEGNEGAIFSLNITGNDNIAISNIEFADAAANAYALSLAETTGINGIYAGAANVESYTVGGVKNDKMRKGMNIVRTADGKVKKVLVK